MKDDARMDANTIDALVLTSDKVLFYDAFERHHTIGKYVPSGKWSVLDGILVNNGLGVDSDKERIDFYADFPYHINVEAEARMRELDETNNFILLQLFTRENYGTRTFGDGYGVILIRNPDSSGSVRLARCSRGNITYLGRECLFPTFPLGEWHKIRLESNKNNLRAYIDDKLTIEYRYPFYQFILRALRINPYPSVGGIAIIKGQNKVEVGYLRVFTKDSDRISINKLQPGWIVEVRDKHDRLVTSAEASGTSLTLELDVIIDGHIRVIDDKGALLAETLRMHITGGDSFDCLSINIDGWIQEAEDKLFSGTFWREDKIKGGIIARLGGAAAFAESTEFAYFYYLHWKYLIKGKSTDLQRIKKMRALLDWLRENDRSKKHFGLFYERVVVERDQMLGIMTRNIVQGTTARFLAHYYLLTGEHESLEHLITLLDQMIAIGIVDPASGKLRGYDPVVETLGDIDKNIKNSYFVEAYILGYSLTGNESYLNVATRTTDWLIEENWDPISKSFPRTSTHDSMEFLEAVWNIYLATRNRKYYDVVKDSLQLYFDLRYRGKLIPFRYYGATNETYSFDTLTPLQMFLATKLAVWGENDFPETNKNLLAYLYSIRNIKAGDKLDVGSLWYYRRWLGFRLRRWHWDSKVGDKQYLWNFRYSAITNAEVRDDWASRGNWMSFSLSYLLGNLYSLKYGALISIFPGRYYPGQPYIAFTQAKITEYKVSQSEVTVRFSAPRDSEVKVVIPNWGKLYNLYLDDILMLPPSQASSANLYAKVITLKMRAGERTLQAKLAG